MSGNSPALSVILPAYNAGGCIDFSIRSILDQTCENFEAIFVNDGSTDETLMRMKHHASKDPRVTIIDRENKGLVVSLNEAIMAARGEFIIRMDADDICLPNRFGCLLNKVVTEKLDVCGSYVRTFGGAFSRTRKYYLNDDALKAQLLFNSCFAHPSVIIRTSVARDNLYSEQALHAEDYELWCRLAGAGYRFANYPEVLLKYRIHAGQISNRMEREQTTARKFISNSYRVNCFPEFPPEITNAFLSRGKLFSDEYVGEIIEMLMGVLGEYNSVRNVFIENSFLFLLRHCQVSGKNMFKLSQRLGLSKNRIFFLGVLAALNASQSSTIFRVLNSLK